jgi:hypothetical protein
MSLFVKPKSVYKKNVSTQQGLFNQILITKSIPISINNIGNNIKETLEQLVAFQVEGKCIVEGYIKPNTIEIITFSSGLVKSSNVIFEVVFQCEVCSPVEGMHINCVAKHINKAGIRAEVNEAPSPVVIFIARDHNYTSPLFSQIKENDEIKVRVIGQRFELNDKYISIIAELIETGQNQPQNQPAYKIAQPVALKNTVNKLKVKTGKITVPKKISIAKEISTELAKEIAAEAQIEPAEVVGAEPQAVPLAVQSEVVPIQSGVVPIQSGVVGAEPLAAPLSKKSTKPKLKLKIIN